MLALVFFTLWFDKDFLKGIYVTLGGTIAIILALISELAMMLPLLTSPVYRP